MVWVSLKKHIRPRNSEKYHDALTTHLNNIYLVSHFMQQYHEQCWQRKQQSPFVNTWSHLFSGTVSNNLLYNRKLCGA